MLDVDDLHVSFGGVKAVDGVSLEVVPGSTVGLVGPNGSGKSTFLNGVCGLVSATGRVEIDGATVPLGRPGATRRHGVLRTFQTPQVADGLTCLENVLLADSDRSLSGPLGAMVLRPLMSRREHRRWHRAHEALERVGLGDDAAREAGLLTYGQRRLLELARVIAAEPSYVLLDEPSAGLNDEETTSFAKLLAAAFGDDIGVLLVDHKVDFLDSLCDHMVVLELGQVVAAGRPDDVWADQRVIDAYLGTDDVVG